MLKPVIAIGVASLLAGCAGKNLYLAHHTVVGVNAAVNSEQTSGHVIVGYDRNFAAIVPKTVSESSGGGHEAMAAAVCSKLEVDGIFLTQFSEAVATGSAATDDARFSVFNSKSCQEDDDSNGGGNGQ